MDNETGIVPYTEHDDGWEDAAEDAASTVIRGQLLKFADWRWTYGQNATELPKDSRLLAVGTAHAWVKWQASKPVEHRMRKRGEPFPEREELGDNRVADWEAGFDGQPKDPWQETRYVYLLGKDAEAYTFSTSSWGGRSAVIELGDQISRMRWAKKGAVPLVELHAAEMKTKFGRKSKPVFKVVAWRSPDGGDLPDAPAPKQIGGEVRRTELQDEMSDEIPF